MLFLFVQQTQSTQKFPVSQESNYYYRRSDTVINTFDQVMVQLSI